MSLAAYERINAPMSSTVFRAGNAPNNGSAWTAHRRTHWKAHYVSRGDRAWLNRRTLFALALIATAVAMLMLFGY